MTKKTIKSRVDDLEKVSSTDTPQILVIWDDDELQDMKPGDILVTWDDDEGLDHGKKDN
jgi:hypothetical protein